MTTIDDIELPHMIRQLLSLGPKHPVRGKFVETQFLADIDIFLLDFKHREVPGDALCEIEYVAKAYGIRVKQTQPDKGVEKARKYHKGIGLVTVLFDKGIAFCLMRKKNL